MDYLSLERQDWLGSSAQFCTPTQRRVNGRLRPRGSEEYDYGRLLGVLTRVEVKHSRLQWSSQARCWFVRFYDIKRDLHDELRLAIYTPFGVCIYVHDGALGVQTSGRAIAIQLYGL